VVEMDRESSEAPEAFLCTMDALPTLAGLGTDRLRFERLGPEHQAAWLPFLRSPEATQFLILDPDDPDLCRKWFERQWDRYASGTGGLHAVLDRTTGELLGQAGLLVQVLDGRLELEVGYHFLPAVWGRGYASEAAQACRDLAFERSLAPSVISIIHTSNTRSANVARRNGMAWERNTLYRGLSVDVFRVAAPAR